VLACWILVIVYLQLWQIFRPLYLGVKFLSHPCQIIIFTSFLITFIHFYTWNLKPNMPYFKPFFRNKQTNSLNHHCTTHKETKHARSNSWFTALCIHLPAKNQVFFLKCIVAILSNKTIQGKAKIDWFTFIYCFGLWRKRLKWLKLHYKVL
jgi:hypothetical protein